MNRFGFLGHPIDSKSYEDFSGGFIILKKILGEKNFYGASRFIPPYRLCTFEKVRSRTGEIVAGDIMAVPLMPVQIASMPEEKVLDVIEKAIRVCQRLGDKIVGLGGFTSVVGNEGEVLSKRVDIPLTSGNSLTAALTLDGVYKAAKLMDTELSSSTVAIIGATGDIGSICTKILSRQVKKMNLAARNEAKLNDFAKSVKMGAPLVEVEVFKYTKDAVKSADIVISATSALTTIIDPEQLKSGAIVCDVSLPPNIAKEVAASRNDILVFEGGLAKITHLEDVQNKKLARVLPQKGIYGCVAETMALAFEQKYVPYSIGRGNITEEKVNEIKKIADKHGIVLADFFCGYRFFSEKDLDTIRQNAKSGRGAAYASTR